MIRPPGRRSGVVWLATRCGCWWLGAGVHRAYRAAADHGYLYHEFGDACLLLP